MYKRDPILVSSTSGTYSLKFDQFKFEQKSLNESDYILLDNVFGEIAAIPQSEKIIRINSGEDAKSILEVARVMNSLAELGANKSSRIIAIGGGTVQDLATFVASTYMRGVSWIYFPTTLQAMADSCVGGKSAINVGTYKNLIGNFHPPHEVLIDAGLVRTLSSEDVTCGLVESVKIGYAFGGQTAIELLELIGSHEIDQANSSEIYESIIEISLQCKKYFVEKDEFDQNIRRKLNFGHTYGHAIEASTDYQIHHGLAVGLGILASFVHRGNESIVPVEEKLITVIQKLLRPHKHSLLRSIQLVDRQNFSKFIRLDKKITNSGLRFIHSKNGTLEVVTLPNTEMVLNSAFESVLEAANALE